MMIGAAADISIESLAACLACLTAIIAGALQASNQSHQCEAHRKFEHLEESKKKK